MTLSINQKGAFYIYATIVFITMCTSNRTMYTNHVPENFLLLLSIVQMVFFCMLLENTRKHSVTLMIVLIGIMSFSLFYKQPNHSFFRVIISMGSFSTLSSVIFLSQKDKSALLDFISNAMCILLTISLIGWCLYLAGYTFPVFEYVDLKNDQHYLNNHYVFYDNANRLSDFFPRFRAFFIEPGQLATPCLFLFFARGAILKDKINIILLLAILFSFSLIGYVALFIGIFLKNLFVDKKYRIARIIGFVLIIYSIGWYSLKNASEDDPLMSLIIERLEYDEELGISGNNRTDVNFDNHFNRFLKSDKIFWGMGDEIKVGYGSWTNHASGIKKFFVNFGLLGIITMILLTGLLLKRNYCRETLLFFIIIWMAFLVRDMLQTSFWLILAILGFYNLHEQYLTNVVKSKYLGKK